MKTFTKTTITKEPRLVISYDEISTSPREWTNLGYFITKDRNYYSPDDYPELLAIITETGDEAENQAEHMEMIKSAVASRLGEKVLAIYPICKYEHSGVAYHRGTTHGFDYSNNGFYIITEKTQKECGVDEKKWEAVIDSELENYNQWCSGAVAKFSILFFTMKTVKLLIVAVAFTVSMRLKQSCRKSGRMRIWRIISKTLIKTRRYKPRR